MDPPVPELPLPTETKTAPPRPLVATELAIKRLPLDPDVLEPVLTNIEPDIRADDDCRKMLPLDVETPLPDVNKTEPPVAVEDAP
eukprot:gene3471-3706_t